VEVKRRGKMIWRWIPGRCVSGRNKSCYPSRGDKYSKAPKIQINFSLANEIVSDCQIFKSFETLHKCFLFYMRVRHAYPDFLVSFA